MEGLFYISSAVAIAATAMVVTRRRAMHALLYLAVSLLAVAAVLFSLGAPFAAALEVIVYAGGILVMLTFVVMMTDQGPESYNQETRWLAGGVWVLPVLLTAALLVTLVWALLSGAGRGVQVGGEITPRQVGVALTSWQGYALALELASMLLLAAIVGVVRIVGRKGTVESREWRVESNGKEQDARSNLNSPLSTLHTPLSTDTEGHP